MYNNIEIIMKHFKRTTIPMSLITKYQSVSFQVGFQAVCYLSNICNLAKYVHRGIER